MPQQTEIKRSWIPTLLNGLALSAFGVLIAVWPSRSLYPFILIFGGFLLFSGMVHVLKGVNSLKRTYTWIIPILVGAFEIILGIYMFQNTNMSEGSFISLLATYLVIRGAVETIFGMITDAEGKTKTFLSVSGVVTLLIGLSLYSRPDVNSSNFAYVVGSYAIFVGAWTAGTAMRMRSLHGDSDLEEDTDVNTNKNSRLNSAVQLR
jgi:uncharacterized membrane protein HdeD (DUF308 family)